MRRRMTEPGSGGPLNENPESRNRGSLVMFLLVLSIVLLFVSGMPQVLVAPALKQMLGMVSLGAVLAAILFKDRPFAGHLTYWDQAAAFLAFSLLAGFFTDAAAVDAYLQGLAAQGAAEGTVGGSPETSLPLPALEGEGLLQGNEQAK